MSESRSAFFYGTLMAPRILHRVCHGRSDPATLHAQRERIQTYPAVLHDYRRHRVRNEDYPAIRREENASVRGTYVTGLTDADVFRLDVFEGGEYRRDHVMVRVLTSVGGADGRGNVEGEEARAETYVWNADPGDLEDGEWDFAEFQKEKMRFWVGSEGEGEYAEVDEAVNNNEKAQDGKGQTTHNERIANALERGQKRDEILKGGV